MSIYMEQGSSNEKEERVKNIMKEVFPNRVDTFGYDDMHHNVGGIHCSTQQEPSAKKLMT